LAEKERIFVAPNAFLYHDKKNLPSKWNFPTPIKRTSKLKLGKNGFCLSAPRDDIKYSGCWVLTHKTDPAKAMATFSNGLLKVRYR